MSFMKPDIYTGTYYIVETRDGTDYLPEDVTGPLSLLAEDREETLAAVRDYCDGEPVDIDASSGVLARLSAPGYMDCTAWTPYATVEEAEAGLAEDYGIEDEIDEDEQADAANDHVDLEY